MEDAIHFSWVNAEVSNAVMLFKWKEGSCHALIPSAIIGLGGLMPKGTVNQPSNMTVEGLRVTGGPWYCRQFQMDLCSHTKRS